MMLEILI